MTGGMSTMTANAAAQRGLSLERYEALLQPRPANDVGGPETCPEADLALVRQIAGQLARRLPSHVELDELVALGNLGLVEARRRYDAGRGVPFPAFAALRIRGAMLDGLRHADPLSRETRARVRREEEAAPVALVHLDEAAQISEDAPPADELLGRRRLRQALGRALEKLPPRERFVVQKYFFEEQPLKQVGAELGVTESRVCQIVGGVAQRLRALISEEVAA